LFIYFLLSFWHFLVFLSSSSSSSFVSLGFCSVISLQSPNLLLD
jgi:hypothetical protein